MKTIHFLLPFALLAFTPFAPAQNGAGGAAAAAADRAPAPLETRLDAVTVYPDGARLVRRGQVPAGDGVFRIEGLSPRLDRASLRVVASGAEVLAVKLEERLVEESQNPRIKALEEQRAAVRRSYDELSATRDQAIAVRTAWDQFLARPIEPDVLLASPEAFARWRETLPQARAAIAELAAEIRAIEAERDAVWARHDALHQAITALGQPAQRRVFDCVVHLRTLAEGAVEIEVEYLVPAARWEPFYDLRVESDMAAFDLVHRARVWQQSGEDWNAVELTLSTAQPSTVGAGPTPRPRWLDLEKPSSSYYESAPARRLESLGYSDDKRTMATSMGPVEVLDQGLNLAYRIPRRESVLARGEPTDMLIGRARIATTPERYAVPADDLRVWVRTKAQNTSPWTLLAGRAAVFIGGAYAGETGIERTGAGADLTLELGPDPAFTIERSQLVDSKQEPGFFGNRAARIAGWRVRIKHDVAPSGAQATPVRVFEALPRPRDQRIEVSLESTTPRPDRTSEDAKQLEAEQGILTFDLAVPPGGETTLEVRTKVTWPADFRIGRE